MYLAKLRTKYHTFRSESNPALELYIYIVDDGAPRADEVRSKALLWCDVFYGAEPELTPRTKTAGPGE